MPGFTTHYLFGVNNIRKLRSEAACRYLLQSIDEYKTVFQLGLQGPDIFFYHLPSQLRKIRPGSIVHTRWTGDFIKCLIEAPDIFRKEGQKMAARAYAAGFLGHYMLDTHMHPYVYCRTGMGEELKEKGYADHIGLESDIDSALLMRYAKCSPSEFPYWKAISFDAKTRAAVTETLYYAYSIVFPELSLSRRFLAGGIRSMQLGTKLAYNPHNYKRHVLAVAEQFLIGRTEISPVIPSDGLQCSSDPLNLQHTEWRNPWNPKDCSSLSVPQIIKKASGRYQKALKKLDCLYAACENSRKFHPQGEPDSGGICQDRLLDELAGFIGQKSYHTGLDWVLGE